MTKKNSKTAYLLTGDVGGTNSRMALYACDSPSDADEPLVVVFYRNEDALPESQRSNPTLFQTNVISKFIQHCWSSSVKLAPLEESEIVACLAIAGFVQNNRVNLTNLGNLLVDGTAIQNNTTDKYLKHVVLCQVINDFVAQGYGCLTLHPSEVELLYGPKDSIDKLRNGTLHGGPKVCVGAGTGLGECYMTPFPDDTSSYGCYPSEGGHVEYAPKNDVEIKLWKYLTEKFSGKNRISVERVVSGTGLANVYEFLAHTYPDEIVRSVHDEFLNARDEQGKVVGINASKDHDNHVNSLMKQAMCIMMSAYGAEVGCAALKFIPTSGLFVTGGLTPKNMKFIRGQHTEFMISYLNKGRVSPLLEKVPLFAVLTEDLGVRGAHKAAKTLYEHIYQSSGGGGVTTKVGGKATAASSSLVPFVRDNALWIIGVAAVSFVIGKNVSRK